MTSEVEVDEWLSPYTSARVAFVELDYFGSGDWRDTWACRTTGDTYAEFVVRNGRDCPPTNPFLLTMTPKVPRSDGRPLMGHKQVACLMGVSTMTVARWLRDGHFRWYRQGIRPVEIDQFILGILAAIG